LVISGGVAYGRKENRSETKIRLCMADRSFTFLQGYDIQLHFLDTSEGQSIDRDEDGFPLANGNNISLYRSAGVDQLVKAMRDLTQKKIIDVPPGNKFVEQFPSVVGFHQSIATPVAQNIATTLIQNSRGAESVDEALTNIWEAVVPNGLMRHFPAESNPSVFNNVPGGKPPPGFALLQSTQITTPPKPTKPPLRDDYDGFAAQGVRYDDEGGAAETAAPESLIGQFFDRYIKAVERDTQLLHSGVTPTGTPITSTAQAKVTI
jgi:hypothetical protein